MQECEALLSQHRYQSQNSIGHCALRCVWTDANNEVFGKLKEFKALVENLIERKIKALRSDNGGEFT
jgi:hypothetical protein